MCGIYGEWSREQGGLTDRCVLEHMTALMERRGPDDVGMWSDERRCQLGFRRLSILDLSQNGHQPITTPDGKEALVFNGEIYNYREIRSQLESKGVSFQSSGDSEVVLYALREWGKAALDKFNGMFALAFYDQQHQKVLLARDHAGIKPLYYFWSEKGLVFGSQYNQILQHPWTQDAAVSPDGLSLYLQLFSIPAPYGLLEGSHLLQPGGWVEVDPQQGITEGRYFEFPVFQEPDLFGEEANEAVDHAITNAVKRCLISDVPVGCFLSGGIDSPLVAAKAKEFSGAMPVFTIGTAGDQHDESQDAAKYANELGHHLHLEQLTSERAFDSLNNVVDACSEPFADFSMFPTLLVSQIASEKVKVVLSGDGPDELFWGYVGPYMAILNKTPYFNTPKPIRLARYWARKQVKKNEPSFYWRSIGNWFGKKTSHFRAPWFNRIFPSFTRWPSTFQFFEYSSTNEEKVIQWARWNKYYGGMQTILAKVDRASMYNSLEVRVPLLDREVVDVASRVDWKSCLDTKSELGKLPLRKMLAKKLKHQTKIKRGFTVAMDTWFRGQLGEMFRELVLTRDNFLGIEFRADQAELMLDEHIKGVVNHKNSLWILLSLALWQKHHYENRDIISHKSLVNIEPIKIEVAS